MKNEVLDFINRRWSNTDAHWTDGNCYWFSHILSTRFPYLKIYYLPIIGHFIAGTANKYYDANGEYIPTEKPILLSDIKQEDDLYYKRIVRDCIL